MSELIPEIERQLSRAHPDYLAQLQPGVSPKTLDEFEARTEFVLPRLFRELYRWRNGQSPNCTANLIDNWMFSPFEDAINTKDVLDGMIGYDFDDPKWWSRGWIPFLDNGGGDHLCLDLTAEFNGTPGQLITFWHDSEQRAVNFPDMESFLISVLQSLVQSR